MSTPNFNTNMGFPLYVSDASLYCTESGLEEFKAGLTDCDRYTAEAVAAMDENKLCGLFYDDWWQDFNDWTEGEIRDALEMINRKLLFHKIELKSGYYSGVQFFVEKEHDVGEMNNEDCRYEFGLFLSQAKRRHRSEINKVGKFLKKTAIGYGFKRYRCIGIFSNGEAIYEPV
jgi:hypothetical protein